MVYLRGNSQSSRSVDGGIAIYADTEEELTYPESWHTAKEYIGKAGGSRSWNTGTIDTTSEPIITELSLEAAPSSNDYTIELEKLKNDNQYSINVQADVNTETCTAEVYHPILVALGAKLSEARDERRRLEVDRTAFIKWCTQNHHLRPLSFSKSRAC